MRTLFVTDLDGTLLTREERVSSYSCERLNQMIDAGMIFTYATARSASSARKAVEGLHINMPVVLYNGGLIYNLNTHETLYASYFTEEDKKYVLSVLSGFGIMPFVFGAREQRERVAWITGGETPGMQRYLARRKEDARMLPVSNVEDLLRGNVFYFKCIGPREQLQMAWDILKYDARFICIFHQETWHSDFWMEISTREATKANGVKRLKQFLGCDRVVCFGDTSNDSDMFDVCDEKYAVRNADEWLKEKATGVVGYCEEDGVAKWLEQNSGF